MHVDLKLVDWLTLFALVAGPAIAVGIQLWFTQRSETRDRQWNVLDTLLAYRGRILHTDSIRALNTVPLVYYGHAKVRAKFRALITSVCSDGWKQNPVPQATITATDNAIAELLSEMARVLKYDFDDAEIKAQAYAPKAFADEQQYQAESRAALLPILRGETTLRVSVEPRPLVAPAPAAPPLPNNQPRR